MRYRLAIDIGASSGRHIVGWTEDGELKTEELYRFPNGTTEQNGHLIWDEYCRRCGKPLDGEWYPEIARYEREVLENRQ